MAALAHVVHPFGPLFDEESRVLMLGTLPSPKAREVGIPYGHPQNRFWPVLAALFDEPLPPDPEGKRALALRHHVAIWDTISECDIEGASDASIKHVVPSDLSRVLDSAPIQAIFATGTKSGQLYRRYQEPVVGRPITVLPSTSPANARLRLPDLIERYRVILDYV